MPMFEIEVCRTSQAYLKIKVEAENRAEAELMALDEAPNHDFSEGTSGSEADYSVE